MRLTVRVTTRAVQERVAWDGQTLRVWVRPAAVEGAANRATRIAVAGFLKVAPGDVRIVAGAHSRLKVVDVDGVVALPSPDA